MTSQPSLSLAGFTALLLGCGDAVAPQWPVAVQLRLVNSTDDVVFIKAVGDESLYPGVAQLAPGDSACTTVYAYADPVFVEVHSTGTPGIVYGSAALHPLPGGDWRAVLTAPGWRAVATTSGVTAARSASCSY